MIPQELIVRALALTGNNLGMIEEGVGIKYISISLFFTYLFSYEFIVNYDRLISHNSDTYEYPNFYHGYAEKIGTAIYEYQKGNEQLIVDLLSKI